MDHSLITAHKFGPALTPNSPLSCYHVLCTIVTKIYFFPNPIRLADESPNDQLLKVCWLKSLTVVSTNQDLGLNILFIYLLLHSILGLIFKLYYQMSDSDGYKISLKKTKRVNKWVD